MYRRRFLFQAVGTCILCLGSCKRSSSNVSSNTVSSLSLSTNLTLSAAASMQEVLEPLRAAYKVVDSTAEITYNLGASGSLAQQIIQGAPVDMFLSASSPWMDALEAKGRVLKNSRQALVQNAMVLVVPKDHGRITNFQTLATANKIAIGEPDSVPAGRYAKELLTSMGLFGSLRSKLVFGKNVRHVLSYVETGNVDAGLVYATDALISKQVRVVATAPVDSHGAITYSVAVVKDSGESAAAHALIDFLVSAPALEIFQAHGFVPIA